MRGDREIMLQCIAILLTSTAITSGGSSVDW